jgi:RNA polymerase sigma factor (TIGR02999 family)
MDWKNRAHFFGVAAHLMRLILVDHARKHRSEKHGGGRPRIRLEDVKLGTPGNYEVILAVHEALEKLNTIDPRLVQVVELRFFAEMTVDESAEVLGVSAQTVKRDWRLARSWLADVLGSGEVVA